MRLPDSPMCRRIEAFRDALSLPSQGTSETTAIIRLLVAAVFTVDATTSAVRQVLQLYVDTVWIREIDLWRTTGCAAPFRHAPTDPVLQGRRRLALNARRETILGQTLQHGLFSEVINVQTHMVYTSSLSWCPWLSTADEHQELATIAQAQQRKGALKCLILQIEQRAVKVIGQLIVGNKGREMVDFAQLDQALRGCWLKIANPATSLTGTAGFGTGKLNRRAITISYEQMVIFAGHLLSFISQADSPGIVGTTKTGATVEHGFHRGRKAGVAEQTDQTPAH
jgi:hypothetical protein